MCMRLVDALFDDKRVVTVLLILWLCIVITVFEDIGLMNTQFMTIGPSNSTLFMGVVLNTQYKWGLVAGFTFINTAVNDFVSDALSPWILNTITDHKTRYIPYPKWVCFVVTQIWSIYCNIMSVFSIFLAMSQIDFVLIRMAADLTVNAYTTNKFMRNKIHSPEKYRSLTEAGHDKMGSGESSCESELSALHTPASDQSELCSSCRAALRIAGATPKSLDCGAV
jgi:hypothetical protein